MKTRHLYGAPTSNTQTTNWSQYTTFLLITASTTLKFFAIDTAGNAETPKSQTYTINSSSPNSDTGSIVTSTPGTYYHTFSTNATVTVAYLIGGGGEGGDHDDAGAPGYDGQDSILSIGPSVTTAGGGKGGQSVRPYAGGGYGTYSLGTGFTNNGSTNGVAGVTSTGTGGAPNGGDAYTGPVGGGGVGATVIGSINVTAGQTLTVTVGSSSGDAGNGSVSLSWQ